MNQLEQLEASIEAQKELIKFGDALDRLYENKDFRTVILDDYFVQEASRLVLAKSEPTLRFEAHGEAQMQFLEDQLTGIGALKQYFLAKTRQCDSARQGLESSQELHSELLQEGLNNG